MALKKKENKKLFVLFMVAVISQVGITSAVNFDCRGKAFYCLNSTHFMICVDLGDGISKTVDDFLIPCPPPTICSETNIYECEFHATTILNQPSEVTKNVIDTSHHLFWEGTDLTTSVPVWYKSVVEKSDQYTDRVTVENDILNNYDNIFNFEPTSQTDPTTKHFEKWESQYFTTNEVYVDNEILRGLSNTNQPDIKTLEKNYYAESTTHSKAAKDEMLETTSQSNHDFTSNGQDMEKEYIFYTSNVDKNIYQTTTPYYEQHFDTVSITTLSERASATLPYKPSIIKTSNQEYSTSDYTPMESIIDSTYLVTASDVQFTTDDHVLHISSPFKDEELTSSTWSNEIEVENAPIDTKSGSTRKENSDSATTVKYFQTSSDKGFTRNKIVETHTSINKNVITQNNIFNETTEYPKNKINQSIDLNGKTLELSQTTTAIESKLLTSSLVQDKVNLYDINGVVAKINDSLNKINTTSNIESGKGIVTDYYENVTEIYIDGKVTSVNKNINIANFLYNLTQNNIFSETTEYPKNNINQSTDLNDKTLEVTKTSNSIESTSLTSSLVKDESNLYDLNGVAAKTKGSLNKIHITPNIESSKGDATDYYDSVSEKYKEVTTIINKHELTTDFLSEVFTSYPSYETLDNENIIATLENEQITASYDTSSTSILSKLATNVGTTYTVEVYGNEIFPRENIDVTEELHKVNSRSTIESSSVSALEKVLTTESKKASFRDKEELTKIDKALVVDSTNLNTIQSDNVVITTVSEINLIDNAESEISEYPTLTKDFETIDINYEEISTTPRYYFNGVTKYKDLIVKVTGSKVEPYVNDASETDFTNGKDNQITYKSQQAFPDTTSIKRNIESTTIPYQPSLSLKNKLKEIFNFTTYSNNHNNNTIKDIMYKFDTATNNTNLFNNINEPKLSPYSHSNNVQSMSTLYFEPQAIPTTPDTYNPYSRENNATNNNEDNILPSTQRWDNDITRTLEEYTANIFGSETLRYNLDDNKLQKEIDKNSSEVIAPVSHNLDYHKDTTTEVLELQSTTEGFNNQIYSFPNNGYFSTESSRAKYFNNLDSTLSDNILSASTEKIPSLVSINTNDQYVESTIIPNIHQQYDKHGISALPKLTHVNRAKITHTETSTETEKDKSSTSNILSKYNGATLEFLQMTINDKFIDNHDNKYIKYQDDHQTTPSFYFKTSDLSTIAETVNIVNENIHIQKHGTQIKPTSHQRMSIVTPPLIYSTNKVDSLLTTAWPPQSELSTYATVKPYTPNSNDGMPIKKSQTVDRIIENGKILSSSLHDIPAVDTVTINTPESFFTHSVERTDNMENTKTTFPIISQLNSREKTNSSINVLNEKEHQFWNSTKSETDQAKNNISVNKNETSIAPDVAKHKTIVTTRVIDFNCLNRFRGKYSDDNDCQKFYICIGRFYPIVGHCPINTVFSEILKQCTRNLSHCVRKNQFQCVTAGRFSDIWENNVYYVCIKRNNKYVRFKLRCQKGYVLNRNSVTCNEDTSQVSLLTHDSNSKSSSSKSVESSSVNIRRKSSRTDFKCVEEGIFADIHDCRTYYLCSQNFKSEFRRRKKKCDSDEVFHKRKKKCVDADSYECDT